MHLSQKLGRCGRRRSQTNNGASDNFDLIINIDSLLYLNERLHVEDNTDVSDNGETHKKYTIISWSTLLNM